MPKPPQTSKPSREGDSQQSLREQPAKQLFDAAWYVARYPGSPSAPDEAYRDFLDTGMKKGHFPNPSFENFRRPSRARIPQEHLYRVTASPILCRVPPIQYLAPYQIKTRLHKLYNTFDEYLQRAMLAPDAIGPELWESDLRIVAYMDNSKKKLASDFATIPQETLISIIMPTRNRAAIIADAIVSVLMQSYENWELLVIDDASDDQSTETVVKQFDDARIKYFRLSAQAGRSEARNAGLQRSSGRVICYLDDDDQWDPDCLLILLNQMRSQGTRMAYAAHVMWEKFDPDARLGQAFRGVRFAPFNRSLLENTNYISLITLIHDRSLIEDVGCFDTSLKRHEDWDFVLRMTEVGRPIAIPCLLSHSFHAKAHEADGATGEDAGLKEAQAKLIGRSDWSLPFTTLDRAEHLAFSLPRKAWALRQKKLSTLPVEPVQIVIPNYESVPELKMCLQSIAEHTMTPYQILIIDNGSSQETYAQLETLPTLFENVRVFKEHDKSGFSFAVNRGLAEVMDRNEKILILNNDTLATPGWLDELRYVLFKHQDAGMAVPRQVLPANSRITKVHMPAATSDLECDINLSLHHSNIIDLDFDIDDGLIEVTYAPLFCSLVRPESIRASGGLDSGNAPHYRSDWILCDFIRRHLNQRIIYTPHSKVYHLQGIATETRKASDSSFLSQRSLKMLPQASD
ncbi:glycosyltransferase involved in cell wall biosynthesis [Microvirga flocculans]|uniref:Glycosyltransferase involved in cell wall biosynthesis n=2 Tax=Microvirga flocculans TaxID=217168 RepID=A0A7W6IHC4_9HYPH|nr:glycosyltransferase [Microvirga flocculans]MBB4041496.1 glycosyltransferase involved in cell wall biosynthesis [Microvirga flocculans]